MVADQVGAVSEPLAEYLQACGPVFRLDPKGQESQYGIDEPLQVLDEVVRVKCGSSPSAMYDRTRNPLMALSCSMTPVVTRTFPRSRDCISIILRLATVGRSPIRIQHLRIGRLRQAARDSFAQALVTWAMDGKGDGARVWSK